jgi:DNA polymerase I-like protein with 3'-5' exonuclease and polymerase domains
LETLSTQIPDWLILEHDVATILTEQEIHGWYFDEPAAWQLESTLRGELEELNQLLRNRYPHIGGAIFTPKRLNGPAGYFKGTGVTAKHRHCGVLIDVEECSLTRLKDFNPTSRDHIAWVMKIHHGWKPKEKTASGKAVIDEVVLKDIGSEEALQFFRCLELTKQLGMLSEGINGWLKLVRNHRIHHHCSVATNTFRCAHRKPNLAQVPSDEAFRKLFKASPGYVMVGADLSGIELRMLAHYLARYDGGRYADVLLNGDIHQENADKIGISRRLVKTVTYAFLYGAGDAKIGLSYDPQLSSSAAKKKGAEIRQAYMDAIPGLEKLVNAVKSKAECGHINLCDGRRCAVDGSHKALNYLLQGSAGIIAKRWMKIANDGLPDHTHQLAFIHDELQFETTPDRAEFLKHYLERCAESAGEYYNLRIRIDAEGKVGDNWAEVH